MAIGRIPLPGLPGKGLADNSQELLKQMLQKRIAEDKLQQDYFANEQLNQYRNASLGLEREKFGAEQQLKPLKMELLREKILAARNAKNETPEEKSRRRVEEKTSIAENVENMKAGSKLKTSGRDLVGLITKANEIKQLLAENPDLTGIIQGGLSTANISTNKKLASFDQKTRKLQADMARYGSSRGGAQALKWAEKSKPGIFKTTSYNLGMIDSILEDAKSDYDEIASEYAERTGKEYPIKFPEILAQTEQNQKTDSAAPSSNAFHWIMKNGKLVRK